MPERNVSSLQEAVERAGGHIDIRDLCWEDRERVLRLLFAKLNQGGRAQTMQILQSEECTLIPPEQGTAVKVAATHKQQVKQGMIGHGVPGAEHMKFGVVAEQQGESSGKEVWMADL
jgi:hypothetical protein